jgi:glutamyl-tRNA reductase
VLEALSRGLTQKMLHGTLAELSAAEGDSARRSPTGVALFLRRHARTPDDGVATLARRAAPRRGRAPPRTAFLR